MTGAEPICADCHFWRDYRDDIEKHPDYDGHCWFKGIMTLWVAECDQHNKPLDISGWEPLEFPEPKPKLSPDDYVPNQWREWEKKAYLKGTLHE